MSDTKHIIFPEDDYVLSCMISAGQFCRLNITPHPIDYTQDYHFYLFKNDQTAIRKFLWFPYSIKQ